jgi:CRISPR-associated endonuclease Cas1
MAATRKLSQLTPTNKLSIPRRGVVTLFGYGIQARVERGHLLLDDGIGADRRHFRLPRVGHGLQRLVIIGADGMLSLAALRWLADQGVALTFLQRDGKVMAVAGPVYPSDARLRRAQSLASLSGTALRISRELIRRKLEGQEKVARRKLLDSNTANAIGRYRDELVNAETTKTVGLIEAQAAGLYWAAFRTLPVNFPRKDESRTPQHWQSFGNRASLLTGSPRRAVNPANAILNYLYALLEAESRLALAALGLDPGIGFLHVGTANRDSLACDLMEVARADVDAFLIDSITRGTLKREWFFEQRDGGCRLMAEFAASLSETAPSWGRVVAPMAEWMTQTLWSDLRKTSGERPPATRLTQQRRSEGRGNEYVPTDKRVPHALNVCAGCGSLTKGGQNCPKCGREISRQKLMDIAKLGRVIGHSAHSRKKQSEAMKRHEVAKREWLSTPKPSWPTEQIYTEEIQPRLSSVTIAKIASNLGISEPYAAEIRAGRYCPHPRHWQALAKLTGVDSVDQRAIVDKKHDPLTRGSGTPCLTIRCLRE